MSRFVLCLDSLRQNVALARRWSPPGARLRAMVKADAYGHGLEALADTLGDQVEEIGVSTLGEGLWARSFLAQPLPIFLMSGDKDWTRPDYLETVQRARLTPVLSSLDELAVLLDRLGEPAKLDIEVKLDTGMGRLGIDPSEIGRLGELLQGAPGLSVVGFLTHYAASDEEDLAFTLEQDAVFRRMLDELPERMRRKARTHSCNTGALLQRGLGFEEVGEGTTTTRPGMILFGAAPSSYLQDSAVGRELEPVALWKTRVAEVRQLPPGRTVGYGRTWSVPGGEAARVAVLPVGYADGYRRSLGGRGRVLIRGGSFPVVGRISMDLVSVLVDEGVRVGDEVVLLGRQEGPLGSDEISVWELAELCDTIPYEIWTGLGTRVNRVVVPG